MVGKAANTTVATTIYAATTKEPESWIESILNRIPLPRWAIYALAGVALFIILLFIICICCCCCKSKKKKKEKGRKIDVGKVPGDMTSQLIQPGAGNSEKGEKVEYRGRVQYSLEYNFQTEELTVSIKQAASLKAMDLGGTSDPYAIVYVSNDTRKKYETKVNRKTLNPVFNESFVFKVTQEEVSRTTAVVQIYDFNRFLKHDVIGEMTIPLGEVNLQHVLEDWKELGPPGKTEHEHLGDICFSLRYVPSNGKLTVIILEAKNLKRMDSDGFSDPFVKVHLALNRKKWKRKKTAVKPSTLKPYFNESFTFDVSLEQMKNVDLIISVWDHDKVGKNEQIGKLFLGCRASGNALNHWSDMLAHPRRPMAQWHKLQEAREVDKILDLKRSLKPSLLRSLP
ncbi:synaptotagmin 1 L homeolog isoform X1 [Xenopus laevis]|uniref:MGC86555 protein n=2 Tax=Xenopus laevis TaxID=8355 RepID=Q66KE5_XENLA|nr:synaptotagmin 1 L homeolog [Xenopus laevis]XP_018112317.1 synaptotagmin 1 L homeolog isoform X1 [Xenopus laevis]XP_018112318.1 synaptotagmin 1 L homeolog isoform X1 [Xenopus laevis]AAH80438.1 MGC86555 protein [Xenopus laevis]OCT83880.1 hypothetical protein XELAEV_18022019mg [Xenopus laevis]